MSNSIAGSDAVAPVAESRPPVELAGMPALEYEVSPRQVVAASARDDRGGKR